MKTSVLSGLLVRSLLVASFSSLVACSSVLQANRLSRSCSQQPAEMVVGVSPESVPEKASLMDEARQPDAEAVYTYSMGSGYRWVFILKEGTQLPAQTDPTAASLKKAGLSMNKTDYQPNGIADAKRFNV